MKPAQISGQPMSFLPQLVCDLEHAYTTAATDCEHVY